MIRISTIARLTEDSIISATSSIARRAKNVVHATKLEYRARKIVAAQEAVQKTAAELHNMSRAERKQWERDEAAIIQRAGDIIAARTAKTFVAPKTKKRAKA